MPGPLDSLQALAHAIPPDPPHSTHPGAPGAQPLTQPYKSSEIGAASISQDVTHSDLKRLCCTPAPGHHHGLQNTGAPGSSPTRADSGCPLTPTSCSPPAKDLPGGVTCWPSEWDGKESMTPMPKAPWPEHQAPLSLRKAPQAPEMEAAGTRHGCVNRDRSGASQLRGPRGHRVSWQVKRQCTARCLHVRAPGRGGMEGSALLSEVQALLCRDQRQPGWRRPHDSMDEDG